MPSSRGRPSKFGRSAKAIGLTLPEDVVAWLRSIHPDPASAIVSLFEGVPPGQVLSAPRGQVELVQVSRQRALIVINPIALKSVDGASTIPLARGEALIALDPGKGVADFERAMLEGLQRISSGTPKHAELARLRQSLRRWRRDGFHFHMRSIIVVERAASRHPVRPLLSVGRRSATTRTPRQAPAAVQRRVT